MTVALILLAAIVAVGATLYIHHRLTAADGAPGPQAPRPADECCGQHAVCEKKPNLSAEIVYFDDEELDHFKGRGPAGYTPEEIEQFREVLLTLLPADVEPWGRSLQLRGVELPEALRDEFIMMANDV